MIPITFTIVAADNDFSTGLSLGVLHLLFPAALAQTTQASGSRPSSPWRSMSTGSAWMLKEKSSPLATVEARKRSLTATAVARRVRRQRAADCATFDSLTNAMRARRPARRYAIYSRFNRSARPDAISGNRRRDTRPAAGKAIYLHRTAHRVMGTPGW